MGGIIRAVAAAVALSCVCVSAAFAPPVGRTAESGETTCPSDFDGNGVIDLQDLEALIDAWGPCEGCPEDLNGDGVVDIVDLLSILASWGLCTNEGSAIGNASNDGTDIVITEPGLYLLAVTVSPRDPSSDPGAIFLFADPVEVSGPDGPGSDEIINSWQGTPPDGGVAPGGYIIALTGVTFSSPPPPGASVGPDFVEGDDAGPLPGDAKETTGSGPLSTIAGELEGDVVSAGGSGDFEDMYVIFIESPESFSAATASFLGGATEFDSRLYLFDADGFGLLGNDDTLEGAIEVPVDIKPGGCPNPFNRNSHGVLPVAVLGAPGLDVTDIDVPTMVLLRADGVGGAVPPRHTPNGPQVGYEDVATPLFSGESCACHDLGPDGLVDLTAKFDTDEIVDVLELDDLTDGTVVELAIAGALLDGTPFVSSDCITLVPPGTPPGFLTVRGNPDNNWVNIAPEDNQQDGGGFGEFDRDWPIGTIVTLTAPAWHEGQRLIGWRWNGLPLRKYDNDSVPGETRSVSVIVIYDVQEIVPVYAPVTGPGSSHGR
ncbi:MAG: hypothetical protein ACYTGG_01735 [Planctomycetota bacterium]|jgi:hypothetical protein